MNVRLCNASCCPAHLQYSDLTNVDLAEAISVVVNVNGACLLACCTLALHFVGGQLVR